MKQQSVEKTKRSVDTKKHKKIVYMCGKEKKRQFTVMMVLLKLVFCACAHTF